MTMQIFFAVLILAALSAFVLWLQIINRRETNRRAKLSPEDRKRLERSDAIWSQRFGF